MSVEQQFEEEFTGQLVSVERGRQLGIARELRRRLAHVIQEPIPDDLRVLADRLEQTRRSPSATDTDPDRGRRGLCPGTA
jgi:hypothetical protein